ncbi:MAG: HAD family hydrolase [Tardiphaga sp.]|nr:HAD family hydrolase [Tardiphaga sp.]
MTAFDLVIFDCDGVLVDSEALACVVHAEVLTAHGYEISAEQVHQRFLGRSSREARAEIETEMGRALPDEYTAALKATIDHVFDAQLQPVPHIADALARITQRVCVASSGTPTRIRSSLATTGLIEGFGPHLFSASQVTNGKPAPDLFLFAAAEMGVPPARCVVIEDSVPGVTGAAAAGMTVFGFHGGAHCHPASAAELRAAGATLTFNDMRQLPGLVTQGAVRSPLLST